MNICSVTGHIDFVKGTYKRGSEFWDYLAMGTKGLLF